ncbi:CPBP family glutamic-type intramembrane protease [Saliphagus infecundisoli]|uniref:Type II CAAX prenyl endopeptidase Rce1 family protein n=1 Tax=Saliphagus infecundisoli TaxID=1849069 RepID=A0ABD5QMK9_9EURY|nr:CPBP family glutamic-type intramembrane protease [Saliphagus infecundisoli]
MDATDVRTRVVGEFLALAFGISWTGGLVLFLAGIGFDTVVGTALLVVTFMWGPAVAAIVVARRRGESIRARCGIARGRPRWIVLAWLLPVGLLGATIGVGAAIPGVSLTTDYATYFLEAGLSEADAAATVEQLEALPVPAAAVFVGQALVAGATINALAAAGEELGWRGLLLSELSELGFWPVSLLTGVVWGSGTRRSSSRATTSPSSPSWGSR